MRHLTSQQHSAASKKGPIQGRAQHHPIATVWSILDEDNHGTMKEGLHIA
jgi:hypothetical protein